MWCFLKKRDFERIGIYGIMATNLKLIPPSRTFSLLSKVNINILFFMDDDVSPEFRGDLPRQPLDLIQVGWISEWWLVDRLYILSRVRIPNLTVWSRLSVFRSLFKSRFSRILTSWQSPTSVIVHNGLITISYVWSWWLVLVTFLIQMKYGNIPTTGSRSLIR